MDEGKWNKEEKQQRWQDPKYHTYVAKHNKEAMQLRWQDPKYYTDEAKMVIRSSTPYR